MFNHVGQFVQPTPVPVPFTASVPMARLDWTVSPRFELGYRLPSGFGEVDFAYRFLLAEGSGTTDDPIAAPDATAALTSHLNLQVADLDYGSSETSLESMLGPGFGMKWRLGLRTADMAFDSRADEPLAATAPAGSGFYERSVSDHFWGIGPHASVELSRRCCPRGWASSSAWTAACCSDGSHKDSANFPPRPAQAKASSWTISNRSRCSAACWDSTGGRPATRGSISCSATRASIGGTWAG